jgi:hypothetical protein
MLSESWNITCPVDLALLAFTQGYDKPFLVPPALSREGGATAMDCVCVPCSSLRPLSAPQVYRRFCVLADNKTNVGTTNVGNRRLWLVAGRHPLHSNQSHNRGERAVSMAALIAFNVA